MAYSILFTSSSRTELRKLPKSVQVRIVRAIEGLADQPRPPGVTKLQGDDNLWRIRVGSYRIVYEIHDDRLIVVVIRIADRKDVYR